MKPWLQKKTCSVMTCCNFHTFSETHWAKSLGLYRYKLREHVVGRFNFEMAGFEVRNISYCMRMKKGGKA